jgi:hypothetical protein
MIKMRTEEEIIADIERWAENRIMVKDFKAELAEVVANNKKPKKKDNPLDLNGDGVVDADDRSIAGKVLASGRKSKKKK